MAAIRILLGIICAVVIGCSRMPDRDLLIDTKEEIKQAVPEVDQRGVLLNIALQEVGVRELTGKNDGERVELYLGYTGLKKGHPWCAAYVSWVYGQAGHPAPRTAWSPSLFSVKRETKTILPGTVFGIYVPSLKRIAHAGIVVQKKGDWVLTVEGNTNVNGSREGDGVYRKRRHIRTIARFSDWID